MQRNFARIFEIVKLYQYLFSVVLTVWSLNSMAQTIPGQLPNAPGEVSPKPGDNPAARGKILDDSTKQLLVDGKSLIGKLSRVQEGVGLVQ